MDASFMLAVPSNTPGGLEAAVSNHFGHCDTFTLINIQAGKIAAVDTVANLEHGTGGCVEPVNVLRAKGVGALVVGGLGARPMQACADAGIAVYYTDKAAGAKVEDAVSGLLAGKFAKMQPEQVCKGSGHCHH
jgi:predicted Fe-Mo cluster-binding NifX family protein